VTDQTGPGVDPERQYHNYTTHRIPWFVRIIWIAFWIGLVWYLITYAVPSAKNYF
jgi:hypothetical protein